MNLHIVILAAGAGTRMQSGLPKVLHPIAGQPMLAHVLHTAQQLAPVAVHVIYGHQGELLRERFANAEVNWVHQAQQLGTGHALLQAIPQIPAEAMVLVLYGDVPGLRVQTARELLAAAENALAVLTIAMQDPSGYGRILRDDRGNLVGIVEQKDATQEQLLIQEVNTGFMAAPADKLRDWLSKLSADNAQQEYYLTDCVALARANGDAVEGVLSHDQMEVQGVNDRVQLAQLERAWQRAEAEKLMRAGVTLADPARVDIRGHLQVGADCSIDVNCVFEGEVILEAGVNIGPHCVLKDCRIASGSQVKAFSHIEGAQLAKNCEIGPYARLRPGTQLGTGVKVGNFVETKKAKVADGSKINHLSYVGDAELGCDVNVGAGTITCNYDGANKHLTRIGDGAFIGSNTALVAPVKVGAGATVGAGSTISKDAPEHSLTVARSKQRSISGWVRPQKSTKS